MNNKREPNGVVWVVAGVVFFIEFLVKSYLRNNFAFQSFPFIKNILHITVVFNKGAAFGILKGKTSFLIYIGLIFILILLIVVRREKDKNFISLLSYGLILGGAFSNLFDRIFLGYVVDYIDLRIWPVFNISDACINVGVILLFLNSFKILQWKKH